MLALQRQTPLAEAITASFYSWELRGRGWQVAPYAVELEPPHRAFGLLPQFANSVGQVDDGLRPTFLSAIWAQLCGRTIGPEESELEPFEEEAPFPILAERDTVALRLLAPSDFRTTSEALQRLFVALPPLHAPLSFEFVAQGGRVQTQMTADVSDLSFVQDALEGYFPGLAVTPEEDLLQSAWDTARDGFFVDLGLADEFFLPLSTFLAGFDCYIPLIPALSRAAEQEVIVFQVLFAPVLNPWPRTTLRAIMPAGECLIEDAPEFVPLAKEKLGTPLFSSVLRVGALAESQVRARELVRSTGPFFEQFKRAGSNRFVPLTNDGYPDRDHAHGFLARTSHRTGMILSATEIAALVHPPDASLLHPALVRIETRTKGLPAEAVGHSCVLGVNEHRGKAVPASIDVQGRLRHMHVVGASGTGKSTLLLNLLMQDIAAGHGCALLDPHGDLVDAVLARVPRQRAHELIVFDPSDEVAPVGINLLQATSATEKILLSSDLVSVFQRFATSWGDAMSTVLGNAVLALLESGEAMTLLDLRRFLVEESFRKDFLSRLRDPEVTYFWRHEFSHIGSRALGPILTRLNTFLRPRLVRNVVAQRFPRVKLEQVVNERKIFLAKLAQGLIGTENAHILGALITAKFHQVALARQALAGTERAPFFVYLDEFQHFVTPSVDSLLSEARKYGMGLVLAHQTLRQLSALPGVEAAVLGNVHTRVLFRVAEEDGRRLAEGLSFFRPEDLYSLKQAHAIVRLGAAANDFNIRVLTPTPTDAMADERMRTVQELSRHQFGTTADLLAQEFAQSYGQPQVPAVGHSEARPAQQPPPASDTSARAQQNTSSAENRVASEITRPTPGRGGREHKYLQQLIKRLAEERGFQAAIEHAILDGTSQVDVALMRNDVRIAVEISVSTGYELEQKNVKRNLAAGFDRILLLTSSPQKARGFEKHILAELPEPDRTRVSVISPPSIVEYLDQFQAAEPEQSTVRGYTVKVQRQSISPEEAARRRSDVANLIARSLEKKKEK